MNSQLPHGRLNAAVYERPAQKWVCGWTREGRPCRLGPSPRGRCIVRAECTPRRNGAHWVCTRPPDLGGACTDGPLPDGSCAIPILRCQPTRNFRAKRGALIFWTFMLLLGVLLLGYTGNWRESFISAGQLGFQHGTLIEGCAGCHAGLEQDQGEVALEQHQIMNQHCMDCHYFGDYSLNSHSVALEELTSKTAAAQASVTNPPWMLSLASLLTNKESMAKTSFDCATCHSEHRGKDFAAHELTDMQCQVCHTVQFASFTEDHPEFTAYPYNRRTRIIFDHVRHQKNHYDDTEKVFECSDCHAPDDAGRQMTLKSFNTSCLNCHGASKTTKASRVFHHGDQIAGGGYDIIFFTLPRLDLKTLEKKKIDIGFWPEGTSKGSKDGLTRLGITPFTELLISADPKIAEALARLNDGNVRLQRLDKASKQDLEDVASVIWGIKELLVELESPSDGSAQQPLRQRLETILERELSTREVAALNGQIPWLMFRAALTAWFPWPEQAKQNNLFEEVEAYRKKRCESEPAHCEALAERSEDEDSGEMIGVEWIKTGRWGRNRYSLQYEVSGHSDDFLKAWLDLGLALSQSPKTVNQAGLSVYEQLADTEAEPGESKGPGRCMKCHSIETEDGKSKRINWLPFQPRTDQHTFTKFRHAPHLELGDQKACVLCHRLEDSEKSDVASSQVLASYVNERVTDFRSNFTPMTRATCTTCHTPEAAGDACLSCHNYHVGTFVATMMRLTTTDEAKD